MKLQSIKILTDENISPKVVHPHPKMHFIFAIIFGMI